MQEKQGKRTKRRERKKKESFGENEIKIGTKSTRGYDGTYDYEGYDGTNENERLRR